MSAESIPTVNTTSIFKPLHSSWLIPTIISMLLLPSFIWGNSTYLLVIGLTGALFFKLFQDIGKSLSLLTFTALLASLQWLLAPLITYHIDYEFFTSDKIMLLKVPVNQYFRYVFPATIAFIFGLFILAPRRADHSNILKTNCDSKTVRIVAITLFYLGLSAQILMNVSGSLSFGYFGWLLRHLPLISVILFWFFNLKRKWIYSAVAIGTLLLDALNTGMFGELVYWLLFIFLFLSLKLKPGITFKSGMIAFGILIFFVISISKWEYRLSLWQGDVRTNSERIELYTDILSKNLTNPQHDTKQLSQALIARRLSQGGTISHIIDRIPAKESMASGETVSNAILSALIPRLFWPDKPVAGQQNFQRFTGVKLIEGTSMGITPIGEMYANFGHRGGILGMFFYGLFLSFIYRFFVRSVWNPSSLLVFLMPLVFIRSIQAETDLMRTLTASVKGIMFIVILVLLFKLIFRRPIH